MPACNALIHEFDSASPPYFDDEGDLMLGSYYQFIDQDDQPVSGLIGPYTDNIAAERAAKVAFNSGDF
jgi:hypothetical protein